MSEYMKCPVCGGINIYKTLCGNCGDIRSLNPKKPSGIEQQVCQDIAKRQAIGIKKYGCTVEDNPLPLRDWLDHAYSECLDQAVYLKRAMAEIDAADTDDSG